MSLSELEKDSNAVVEKLSGDERFMSRITSIGLTPGCSIRVIRNDKNRPMLSAIFFGPGAVLVIIVILLTMILHMWVALFGTTTRSGKNPKFI
ncbi:FeoA family protein [Butyrivibrio sp. NC2002]|uniref:FeoA family protein n=1 Tax=Butyrivibrio sp. NC2002 TaxID=1410610 RepID=UPI000B10B461|nr:ferrous iron transport protein A [Butyrivibrio sp. NC2002]